MAGISLVAATYGLVRLAYGLFLPDISSSLGLDPGAAGRISSGASLAYCLAALSGLSARRYPRRLVLAALLTAGIGSAGMALSPGVATFAVSTVLASAGAGFASPGLVDVVERNVVRARQAQTQSVVNSGTGPGLVGAGAMALVLLPDWRLGFVISAAVTVAAGIGVLVLDRPAGAPDGAAAEEAMPDRADAAGDGGRGSSGPAAGWWRVLLVPAVAALLMGAASAAVWTYGRTLLVAEGAGNVGSTVAWMAVGLGGAATVLTARRLSALHPARAWLLTTTTVAVSVAALGLGARQFPVALVACAVFGWGFVAATSGLISWCALLAPARASAGASLLFVTLVLGQAVGSSAVGGIASSGGLTLAFVLAAAVAAPAAACGLSPAALRRDQEDTDQLASEPVRVSEPA